MLTSATHILQARDLLLTWTGRTIRARYQQSALGWLWAVIQPAAQVAVYSIIFTFFVRINTDQVPYALFSFVAVVPWTLIAGSLPDMTSSLVGNMALVTKIYFPREVLPIAALMARLMDLGISAIFLLLLLLYFRTPLFVGGILFLPVLLIIQLMLILGLGLACAALNVFFRDVQSLLTLGIQLWFYASPIIYPLSMVPVHLRPFYLFNPMVGILEGYRDILLNGKLPGAYLWPSALLSSIILLIGYWFFKRVEFQFADIV